MPQQGSAAPVVHTSATKPEHHNRRTVWVITGYLAAGLGLLGVLAYYFANYVTH